VTLKEDGSLGKVDVKALKREGPPRELVQRTARENWRLTRAALADVRFSDPAQPTPAASLAPVEGVTFET
jgi:hypothetical protein